MQKGSVFARDGYLHQSRDVCLCNTITDREFRSHGADEDRTVSTFTVLLAPSRGAANGFPKEPLDTII